MRKFAFAALCAALAVISIPALAQYTPIAATHLVDGAGNAITSGQVCALAVNTSLPGNPPMSFTIGSGAGLAVPAPTSCWNVASGALASGAQLADSNYTSPQYVAYLFTITDNVSGNSYTIGPTQVSCTISPTPSNCSSGTWLLDHFPSPLVPMAIPGQVSAGTTGDCAHYTGPNTIGDAGAPCGSGGGGGGGGTWGSITGTLSSQTDLQTALNAKANTSSLATVATSGNYNDLSSKPSIPNLASPGPIGATTPGTVNATSYSVGGSPIATGNLGDWTNTGIANGNVPIWNSTTSKWTPGTVSGGGAGTTTYSATFNNSGTGAASGTPFNGSAAITVSTNTIGAENVTNKDAASGYAGLDSGAKLKTSEMPGSVVQTGQGNTYSTGTQDMSAASEVKVPAPANGSDAATKTYVDNGLTTKQASGSYAVTSGSNTFTAGTQDFSGVAHTLPSVKGLAASKPATCTVGEEYFATDATAGQNKYYCTSTNTWTQQSGGGISGLTAGYIPTATSGTAIGNSHLDDGVTTASTITSSEALTVSGALQSAIHTLTASGGLHICAGGAYQLFASTYGGANDLEWCTNGGGGSFAKLPQTNQSNTYTAGTQDFSGAAHTLPSVKGLAASKPATCAVGEEYFATDATAGQNKYYCTATNTWTQQSGGGGGLSGMTAGQIPVAATASTVTSSKALSGNGSKIVSTNLGTDPGAGSPLCTDGSGNATTTGCPNGGTVATYGGSGGTVGTPFTTLEACLPVTFDYTAFTAATSNQLIAVFNAQAGWRATRWELVETTPFACSGGCTQITSMSAQLLGASGSVALTTPFPLMGASTPPWQPYDGGGYSAASTYNGTDTISVQLRVTNSNPGNLGNGTATNLTAGQLKVLACGVVNATY